MRIVTRVELEREVRKAGPVWVSAGMTTDDRGLVEVKKQSLLFVLSTFPETQLFTMVRDADGMVMFEHDG